MADNKEIGARLKEAREKAGFATAMDAATALGMKYPTYAGHENGSRGVVRSLEKYARRYKVSLDWLLTGKMSPQPKVSNLAWELYLQLAEMDEPTLLYIQETIEFTKRRGAAE